MFTFFTWFPVFWTGAIPCGTTFHTISETFVFHFLATFFANVTFLAPAFSRFDACCKCTTTPFTNCCNENKILVVINIWLQILLLVYIETKLSFVSLNKTVPKLMIYRILNSNLLWRGLHRYSKTWLQRTRFTI